LQKGAPLDGRQSGAPDTRKAAGFLRDADDQLFNVLSCISKHLYAAWIWVDVARAIDRRNRSIWIAAAIFQSSHHRW